MSVVVALKDKDKFIIACDDRETTDDIYIDSYQRKSKAFGMKGKNDFIIGGTGNVAIADLLSMKIAKLERIDEYTLLKEVIDFQKEYRDTPYIDNDGCIDGSIIVACKDKAYSISPNICVSEIIDYDAIGSGMKTALAVLCATKHIELTNNTRAYLAVKTTGELINTVSTNVYMADTKNLTFERKILK